VLLLAWHKVLRFFCCGSFPFDCGVVLVEGLSNRFFWSFVINLKLSARKWRAAGIMVRLRVDLSLRTD
jgi:hypothetical protein